MPLFRCNSCQPPRVFEADRPTCAECELDPAKDARHGRFFDQLLIIHYDPPTNVKGIGQNVAACNPKVKVGRQGRHTTADRFTGDKSAVTCPRCKATEVYTGVSPDPAPRDLKIGSLEASRAKADGKPGGS